jgi:hypothetical protein
MYIILSSVLYNLITINISPLPCDLYINIQSCTYSHVHMVMCIHVHIVMYIHVVKPDVDSEEPAKDTSDKVYI